MTTDEKSKVAARIRALFAKTEDRGATVEEAAAAAAKANEFITRYNLTLEDLEVRDAGRYIKATVTFECPKKLVRTHQALLHIIAEGNFCDTVRSWGARSYLVGRPENVEFVTWLYGAVQEDMARLAKAAKPAWARSAWTRAFWYGAMATLRDRFRAQRRAQEAETTQGPQVTALVLVTKQALEQAVYELIGKTTKGRGAGPRGGRGGASAYVQGREAGHRLNINRPLGGSTARGALGA